MKVTPVDPTAFVLDEIVAGGTQSDIAKSVALALRDDWPLDWASVGRAVQERWNKAAWPRIKEHGWAILEGRRSWD